jgi:hypothetical protein
LLLLVVPGFGVLGTLAGYPKTRLEVQGVQEVQRVQEVQGSGGSGFRRFRVQEVQGFGFEVVLS